MDLRLNIVKRFSVHHLLVWANFAVLAAALGAFIYLSLYLKTMVYDTISYTPTSAVWSDDSGPADINMIRFNSVINALKTKTSASRPETKTNPFKRTAERSD